MTLISNDEISSRELTFYFYDLEYASVLRVSGSYQKVELGISNLTIDKQVLAERSVIYLPPSQRKHLPEHLSADRAYLNFLNACSLIIPVKHLPSEIEVSDKKGHSFNSKEALELLTKASDQGFVLAKMNLGKAYFAGLSVKKDRNKAYALYHESETMGGPSVQLMLARMYNVGSGVDKDINKVYSLTRSAADKGLADAQCELGTYYVSMKQQEEALRYYQMAADQGHLKAQTALAKLYSLSDVIARDIERALSWYEQASNQGYAEAQYDLANIYQQGEFGVIDKDKAFDLYLKAANQGHVLAQCRLGLEYLQKESEGDLKLGFYWFTQAAQKEDSMAYFCLGECYKKGMGVATDMHRALDYYEKAVEMGLDEAIDCMSEIYEVTFDYSGKFHKREVAFYKKEAAKNNAAAQNALGHCYEIGRGVKKDLVQAVSLYEKASEQGFPMAKYNLGSCYQSGSGVKKDLELAIELYKSALNLGHEDAEPALAMAQRELISIQTLQQKVERQEAFEKRAQDEFKKRFVSLMGSIADYLVQYEALKSQWILLKGKVLIVKSIERIQEVNAKVANGEKVTPLLFKEMTNLSASLPNDLEKIKTSLEKAIKRQSMSLTAAQASDSRSVEDVSMIVQQTVSETRQVKEQVAREAREAQEKERIAEEKRLKRRSIRAPLAEEYQQKQEALDKEKADNNEQRLQKLSEAGILPVETAQDPVKPPSLIESYHKKVRLIMENDADQGANIKRLKGYLKNLSASASLEAFQMDYIRSKNKFKVLRDGLGELVNIDHLKPYQQGGCLIYSFRVSPKIGERVVFAWNSEEKKAYQVSFENYHAGKA